MIAPPFAPLPARLYLARQVREIDRRAILQTGTTGYSLMSRAAGAALVALRHQWPGARRILVLCGAGNNGGDGYLLARLAADAGLESRIEWMTAPEKLTGDAATAVTEARSCDIPMTAFSGTVQANADVIVDALLGTGLARSVEGAWAAAVEAVNGADRPVLSLDIASGLDADSGAERGIAVRANLTVTFIAPKRGLFTGMGPECTGAVLYAPLDVPAALWADMPPAGRLYRGEDLSRLLGPRPRSAHKGRFGHLLVVGGDTGMGGAVRLAGEAALRCGAGLVSIATRPAHVSALIAGCPELMAHGVDDPAKLEPLLARATVVAAGPGLGRGPWASGLLRRVLESRLPLVLDADALNLLAGEQPAPRDWVLTPHPGEAARLLGTSTIEVEADRFAASDALVRRYGGVVLLKGAGTLIRSSDSGETRVVVTGNPGMASGGMGDVLTGVIGALRAQHLPALAAALAGAWVHGTAGDHAARQGERGLRALDLVAHLRGLVNP